MIVLVLVFRDVIRVDPVGFDSIRVKAKKTYLNLTLFRTRVTQVGLIRVSVNLGWVNSGSGLACLNLICSISQNTRNYNIYSFIINA